MNAETICPARDPGCGPCIVTRPHRAHQDKDGNRWSDVVVPPAPPERGGSPAAPPAGAYHTETTAVLVRPDWLPLDMWLRFVQDTNAQLGATDLAAFDRATIPPGAVVVTVDVEGVIRSGLVGAEPTQWEASAVIVTRNRGITAPRENAAIVVRPNGELLLPKWGEPYVVYNDGSTQPVAKILRSLVHDLPTYSVTGTATLVESPDGDGEWIKVSDVWARAEAARDCECRTWARENALAPLVNGHHENCPKAVTIRGRAVNDPICGDEETPGDPDSRVCTLPPDHGGDEHLAHGQDPDVPVARWARR